MAATKERETPVRSKPEMFAAEARELGWETVTAVKADVTTVEALRNAEKVTISWRGEACLNGSSYSNGPYQKSLRNAAACRRALADPPSDPPSVQVRRKSPNSTVSKARPSNTPKIEEPEEDFAYEPVPTWGEQRISWADDLLRGEFIGKEVIWINTISREHQSAWVMSSPEQKQLRIEVHPRTGRRLLSFAAVEGGFRAVYIENIVNVQ